MSIIIISAIFSALLIHPVALADGINVTGDWSGFSTVTQGGARYANFFTLYQDGSSISGTEIAGNNATCVVRGTLVGTEISFHADCPSISYSSDVTGSTDGNTMSGSFLDSQSTSGTFTATKSPLTLNPNTTIVDPPKVTVRKHDVTLVLQKFSRISLTALKSITMRAAKPRLTLEYEVTLSGPQRARLVSARNSVTARNLKPGTYTASYRVNAFKNGRRAFSTKKSPAAGFQIRK